MPGVVVVSPVELAAGAEVVGKVKIRNPGDTADLGDATNPVRTDPTGATTQPISAASLPLPTGAAQEHTAQNNPSSTRLTDGVAFYKATTPSDTQPVSAASLPLPTGAATATNQTDGTQKTQVVQGGNTATVTAAGALKTDGSAVTQPVSAASLPLPADAATATNQTDGSQKSVVRGGAKGTTVAADVTSVSLDANTQALHVKVTGGGGVGVDSNVNIVDPSGNPLSAAEATVPATTRGLMISGYEAADDQAHRLAVDHQGRIVIAPAGSISSLAGFAFGQVITATTTPAAVRDTTYTEQSANAQRSIASANAADTAAGTGARQVKITYLDQTGAGPYSETVTLNGTTYVNTVATNICFIEKIEVVSVGSGGVNAGILTLKAAAAGGGATIGTVAVGLNRTLWAHHYTPTGHLTRITGMMVNHNGTTAGSGGVFYIRSRAIGPATAVDLQVSDFIRQYGQATSTQRNYGTPIEIYGPARIVAWVTPEGSTTVTYRASLDYYDQAV